MTSAHNNIYIYICIHIYNIYMYNIDTKRCKDCVINMYIQENFMTLWVSKGSSKYMCIIIYYSIEKDKIFMTTYQEKLSDHYMMYVWFPSRHLKLNVHQTNFCMVWYVKFRIWRREFLHSTVSGSVHLLSFSNFKSMINLLNTVCISCSSYRMGSKYVKYVSRLLF